MYPPNAFIGDEYAIKFGPVPRVGEGNPISMPISLFMRGKVRREAVTGDVLRQFLDDARSHVLSAVVRDSIDSGKAAPNRDDEVDAIFQMYGYSPKGELSCAFDVTYTALDRRLTHKMPHMLRHSSRENYTRIEVQEASESADV